MDGKARRMKAILAGLIALGLLVAAPRMARAHCDTMSGPVAGAARDALRTGEFESIAIWVGEQQTEELRKRFQECSAVYKMGGEAKDLAERYFIETAVRLHRAAESMVYTGVKPAQPLPPDIAAAEKALNTGDLTPVTDMLSEELEKQTQKWFQKVLEAKKHKQEGVEAGREYVDAYVKYVIYVHGLHQAIQAGPKHGVGE